MAYHQKDQILDTFRVHGNKMTLGQILQHPWGYEFRARATELRKEGYTITVERRKNASENVYRMTPPTNEGQTRFI